MPRNIVFERNDARGLGKKRKRIRPAYSRHGYADRAEKQQEAASDTKFGETGHNGGPSFSYDMAAMPALFQQIYNLVGAEGMEAFIARYAGMEKVYIPKKVTGSELAKAIGDEAAGKIIAAMGGQRVDVPKGRYREGVKKTKIFALKDNWFHTVTLPEILIRQPLCAAGLRDYGDKSAKKAG